MGCYPAGTAATFPEFAALIQFPAVMGHVLKLLARATGSVASEHNHIAARWIFASQLSAAINPTRRANRTRPGMSCTFKLIISFMRWYSTVFGLTFSNSAICLVF